MTPIPLAPRGRRGDIHLYALADGREVEPEAIDASPEIETVSLFLSISPVFAPEPRAEILPPAIKVLQIGHIPVLPSALTGRPGDAAAPERLLPAVARATGPGARRLLRAIAGRARAQDAPHGSLLAPFSFNVVQALAVEDPTSAVQALQDAWTDASDGPFSAE